MVNEYIKSFDPVTGAWTKKSEAAAFAAFLAPELGINPKGVQVDKDGKTYRVYIPLLSAYWHPVYTDWTRPLEDVKARVKSWASS